MKKSYLLSIFFHLLLLALAISFLVRHFHPDHHSGSVSLQWFELATPQEKAGETALGQKKIDAKPPQKLPPKAGGQTVAPTQNTPAGTSQKGNAGQDAVSVRGDGNLVLSQIRNKILKNKTYPDMALRKEIEGTVVVRFSILPNGQIGSSAVIQSSGSVLLDEEGMRTIKRASPLPYYPEAITLGLKYQIEE